MCCVCCRMILDDARWCFDGAGLCRVLRDSALWLRMEFGSGGSGGSNGGCVFV